MTIESRIKMNNVWDCNKKPEECPYRWDYRGCIKENCPFPYEYEQKKAYLFNLDSNLEEKTKSNNKVYNLFDKLLIIVLFIYIVVAAVAFPDQQIMNGKLKKNSDMHFTVQFEQATGIPLYYINKEAVEIFGELIREKYPNASKYEIKLIGNTIESKGINWQDVTGNTMEVYGEIVGVENKEPKYASGAEVTAGLREDYYSTHYNGSKEEYDKYRNGQIMVFNVSYIDARACTVVSLIIFTLIPVFVVVLIYLVLKFLINIIRKHNIHLFKK